MKIFLMWLSFKKIFVIVIKKKEFHLHEKKFKKEICCFFRVNRSLFYFNVIHYLTLTNKAVRQHSNIIKLKCPCIPFCCQALNHDNVQQIVTQVVSLKRKIKKKKPCFVCIFICKKCNLKTHFKEP
jgi:hypothetical protein